MLQRSNIKHGNRERKFTSRKSVNVLFFFTYIVYQQPVHSLRIGMTATGWGTVPCNVVARYRCFGITCCLVFRIEECCIGRGTKFLPNGNTFLSSTLVINKECNFETSEPLIPLIYYEIRGSLFLCNV